jgi:hypothetical protein
MMGAPTTSKAVMPSGVYRDEPFVVERWRVYEASMVRLLLG